MSGIMGFKLIRHKKGVLFPSKNNQDCSSGFTGVSHQNAQIKKGRTMKQFIICGLAAGLLMSAGCSDDKPEDVVTPEESAPAVSITEDLGQKAETATKQATEKLNEATRKAQDA